MKSKQVFFTRGLTALLMVGGLAVATTPAMSQPGEKDGSTKQERVRKHVDHRLDKMEAALKITPAQQPAWAQYRSTVETQLGTPPTPPAKDADAATLARWRADRASEYARKLSAVTDATATLQGTLTDEQRKTLANMIRHEGGPGHRDHDGRGEKAKPAK